MRGCRLCLWIKPVDSMQMIKHDSNVLFLLNAVFLAVVGLKQCTILSDVTHLTEGTTGQIETTTSVKVFQ